MTMRNSPFYHRARDHSRDHRRWQWPRHAFAVHPRLPFAVLLGFSLFFSLSAIIKEPSAKLFVPSKISPSTGTKAVRYVVRVWKHNGNGNPTRQLSPMTLESEPGEILRLDENEIPPPPPFILRRSKSSILFQPRLTQVQKTYAYNGTSSSRYRLWTGQDSNRWLSMMNDRDPKTILFFLDHAHGLATAGFVIIGVLWMGVTSRKRYYYQRQQQRSRCIPSVAQTDSENDDAESEDELYRILYSNDPGVIGYGSFAPAVINIHASSWNGDYLDKFDV